MTKTGDDPALSKSDCNARYRPMRWSVGVLAMVLVGLMGILPFMVSSAWSASKRATEVESKLGADRAGTEEYRKSTYVSLDRINAQLSRIDVQLNDINHYLRNGKAAGK